MDEWLLGMQLTVSVTLDFSFYIFSTGIISKNEVRFLSFDLISQMEIKVKQVRCGRGNQSQSISGSLKVVFYWGSRDRHT